MVYNPDLTRVKERISALLVADLTPTQLDTVQAKFGIGANLCSPNPTEQLFIKAKRDWASHSHAELKRRVPNTHPLIVIDSQTPDDGGIWYIDRFADEQDVEDDQAENTNTLFKLRMKLEDIVISHVNYIAGNTDIREDMDQAGIDYPTPEDFEQDELFSTGFDYVDDRYISPTWVTVTPDEMEDSTDPNNLDKFVPRPDKLYRLNKEVAKENGLKCTWVMGSDARHVTLPDGTVLEFPKGSKVLQLEYDIETAVPRYEKPEGSL